jgi:ubiquinone/menaquinone biosynthesis C-methylase UbiE
MLDMDEKLFADLLNMIDLRGKSVADIGCGTGRHWHKLYKTSPASLTGFDVSAGMLSRLKHKFPDAGVYQNKDNLFADVPTDTFDVIVSTLTVAHIKHIDEALRAWCRILKPGGEMIITDFHPNALAHGGKRTFEHGKRSIAVQNFVHFVYDIEEILLKNHFRIVRKEEKIIDDSVRHYYAAKNALSVFEKFRGSRMIYGLHLKHVIA